MADQNETQEDCTAITTKSNTEIIKITSELAEIKEPEKEYYKLHTSNLTQYSEQTLPFPVQVFPAPISALVYEASKSVGCPPDFIAVPVLAVLATAIGNSRNLEIKKGWIEGPRIYSAIIAQPGSKKSPALNIATKPIAQIQTMLLAAYEADIKRFNEMNSTYGVGSREQERTTNTVGVQPKLRQIKTSNATMEAISKLLANYKRGILYEQDELAAWVKSMNSYRGGQGADLEYWLSFWSGSQCTINRASQPLPLIINNPIVNVTGCIQPDLLTTLSGMKNNGFFDRILLSYPEISALHYTEDELSDETSHAYLEIIKSLYLLMPEHGILNEEIPVSLKFNYASRNLWRDWNKVHDAETNSYDLPYYLKGVWSKLQAYMARIILILQLAENAANGSNTLIIEPETVDKAQLVINYFKSHVYKTYKEMNNSVMDQKIVLAVAWINKHGGKVTSRMLLNNNVARCYTAFQVQELLVEMEDRNLGSCHCEIPIRGGKKTIYFTTNNPTYDPKMN
jgi:hypothetical protein